MNKYILIASNGKGVGKSTFSTSLLKILKKTNNVVNINFADSIRDDAFKIISKHSGLDLDLLYSNYNIIKDQNFTFNSQLNSTFQVRTFLNRYSLFLSEFFSGPVWAKSYLDTVILKTKNMNNSYIVTDDLRRYEELDYLIKKVGRENIFLVYLEKENVQLPSEISFENLLNSKDFDIVFKVNDDWSNQKENLTNCILEIDTYFNKQ